MKIIEGFPYSKKKAKLFNVAKKIATTSKCEKFRHGAILVIGGKVINTSCNKKQYNRFVDEFRGRVGHGTVHAELGAILGIEKKITKRASLYVIRVSREGEIRYSRPCRMCTECLRYVGIRKVFYSIDETRYGILELS